MIIIKRISLYPDCGMPYTWDGIAKSAVWLHADYDQDAFKLNLRNVNFDGFPRLRQNNSLHHFGILLAFATGS